MSSMDPWYPPSKSEAQGGDALDEASLDDVAGGSEQDGELLPWELIKPPVTRYEERNG